MPLLGNVLLSSVDFERRIFDALCFFFLEVSDFKKASRDFKDFDKVLTDEWHATRKLVRQLPPWMVQVVDTWCRTDSFVRAAEFFALIYTETPEISLENNSVDNPLLQRISTKFRANSNRVHPDKQRDTRAEASLSERMRVLNSYKDDAKWFITLVHAEMLPFALNRHTGLLVQNKRQTEAVILANRACRRTGDYVDDVVTVKDHHRRSWFVYADDDEYLYDMFDDVWRALKRVETLMQPYTPAGSCPGQLFSDAHFMAINAELNAQTELNDQLLDQFLKRTLSLQPFVDGSMRSWEIKDNVEHAEVLCYVRMCRLSFRIQAVRCFFEENLRRGISSVDLRTQLIRVKEQLARSQESLQGAEARVLVLEERAALLSSETEAARETLREMSRAGEALQEELDALASDMAVDRSKEEDQRRALATERRVRLEEHELFRNQRSALEGSVKRLQKRNAETEAAHAELEAAHAKLLRVRDALQIQNEMLEVQCSMCVNSVVMQADAALDAAARRSKRPRVDTATGDFDPSWRVVLSARWDHSFIADEARRVAADKHRASTINDILSFVVRHDLFVQKELER